MLTTTLFRIFCLWLSKIIEFKVLKTVIYPITLHGYENSLLTTREEERERGCLRRMFKT